MGTIELAAGSEHVMYNADRDCEAVLSLLRLAPAAQRKSIRSSLDLLIAHIRRIASEERERLQ